jgi:hypothetical protein
VKKYDVYKINILFSQLRTFILPYFATQLKNKMNMNTADFIIGTGAHACSMYLNENVNSSATDPKGDDPVVPVPPAK